MSATAGWFGKVASLGDFVQRRLPAPWIARCDAWLSDALPGAQRTLGARWLDVYLNAPLLRFAWAPGVVDAQWWMGVLMASCDNVGRYFPLVVAEARRQPPEDRVALDHLELWYAAVGRIAMDTLDATSDAVDRMEAALANLPPWPTASPGRGVAIADEASGVTLAARGAASLATLVGGFATHAAKARLAGRSLWWVADDGRTSTRLAIVEGLPDGARLARLLAHDAALAV